MSSSFSWLSMFLNCLMMKSGAVFCVRCVSNSLIRSLRLSNLHNIVEYLITKGAAIRLMWFGSWLNSSIHSLVVVRRVGLADSATELLCSGTLGSIELSIVIGVDMVLFGCCIS